MPWYIARKGHKLLADGREYGFGKEIPEELAKKMDAALVEERLATKALVDEDPPADDVVVGSAQDGIRFAEYEEEESLGELEDLDLEEDVLEPEAEDLEEEELEDESPDLDELEADELEEEPEIEELTDERLESMLKPMPGGYYMLPDGRKIRGKANALDELRGLMQ